MVSTTPYPAVEQPQEKKAWQPVGFTWGLSIAVPIFLDVPRDIVRPGAAINFFGGADFGFFVIGGDAGLQWNPIDLNGVVAGNPPISLSGRSPLTRIYLSLPEVRFQVPDLKVVLPYITGSFDMNFWNFRETQVGCGYWYCSQYSVYRFTPGFTGKAGVGFSPGGGWHRTSASSFAGGSLAQLAAPAAATSTAASTPTAVAARARAASI
jgi:hypothetical protein